MSGCLRETGAGAVSRQFYRIVRSETPTLDDFKSARDLGKPLLVPRYQREWAEGISVYDDLAHAIDRALKFRLQLGRFVVAILVPDETELEIAQTTSDQRHFTIYASAEQILALAQGSSSDVRRE